MGEQRRSWKPVALACVASALAGCTTVHVHSPGGVETHSGFGILQIHFPPEAPSIITQVSGVGVVMGANRLTLGWMDESSVALRDPSRCQAVFFSATREEALAIKHILAARGNSIERVCLINKGEPS